ncbi:hypothetical protein [Alienimonas sp. DA493]|uniref:hypothetical protein n=1 Tax=Alienimonas sp. DA493 TaxID=3373605 RepID=UPI003754922C
MGTPPPLAGMPGFDLTDAAAVRLDAISFFLAGFLLAAAVVMGCWNLLRKDFPKLPRLSYKRALAATALWGLVFLLGLTMISGARELLTPGAWERAGWTYELTDAPPPDPEVARDRRRAGLAALYAAWRDRGDDLPAEVLTIPGRAPRTYRLIEGRTAEDAGAVLAFEPDLFTADDGGADPFVLFVGGSVHQLPREVLETLLGEPEPEPDTEPEPEP